MANASETPVMLVGLMRVREHCSFTWRRPEHGVQVEAEVHSDHCAECVDELRERGFKLTCFGDPRRPGTG